MDHVKVGVWILLKPLNDKVNLTHDQIQDLKLSISDSNLNNTNKALITGLIDFNGWFQQQLLERQISIKLLKMIIFGEPQHKRQHKKIKSKTSTAKTQKNTAASNDENGGIKTDLDSAHSKTKNGRLFDLKLVEENNSLGKAIRYTLKHWEPLTHFLKTEGAPLDNNILEASLKVPIRIRKNAMFYKTEHGAFKGSDIL